MRWAGSAGVRVQVAVAAALLVLLVVVVVAPRGQAHDRPAALVLAHLVFVVVGLGAVLVIEWTALLWARGRVSLQELLGTTTRNAVVVWTGVTGLVVTGMLLRPDTGSPLVLVKLGCVALLVLNGVHAAFLGEELEVWQRARFAAEVPRALLLRGAAAAAVSQVAWWTAFGIGFVTGRG